MLTTTTPSIDTELDLFQYCCFMFIRNYGLFLLYIAIGLTTPVTSAISTVGCGALGIFLFCYTLQERVIKAGWKFRLTKKLIKTVSFKQ